MGPNPPHPSRLVVLLWCALAASAAGCGSDVGAPDPVSVEHEPGLVSESWDVEMGIWDGERPRLQVEAERLRRYEIGDTLYAKLLPGEGEDERVAAHLFDESGQRTATLTAREILYFEEERRFEARGDVVVVSVEGKRLETEHLNWTELDRRIETPGFVRITSPQEQLQGYQLRASEDLATYEILQPTGSSLIEDPE